MTKLNALNAAQASSIYALKQHAPTTADDLFKTVKAGATFSFSRQQLGTALGGLRRLGLAVIDSQTKIWTMTEQGEALLEDEARSEQLTGDVATSEPQAPKQECEKAGVIYEPKGDVTFFSAQCTSLASEEYHALAGQEGVIEQELTELEAKLKPVTPLPAVLFIEMKCTALQRLAQSCGPVTANLLKSVVDDLQRADQYAADKGNKV